MPNVEVSTETLQSSAAHVADLAATAAALAQRSAGLSGIPTRQHFPAFPEGQDVAREWEKARDTFAKGLTQVSSAINRLSTGLAQAAENYERSDVEAADRLDSIHRTL